jgi:hypothetical protein
VVPDEFLPEADRGREGEELADDGGAGGLPGVVVTSAEARDEEVGMLSLARRRSARTSTKDEKGRCRVMNWDMN